MQHGRGAALFPFADAIIESQQVGEALWILEGGTLALGTLGLLPRPLLAGLQQASCLLQQVGDDIISYFEELLVDLLVLAAVVVAVEQEGTVGSWSWQGPPGTW